MTLQEFKEAITVIVDTREQRCSVLLAGLSQEGVRFKTKGLKFGDYSFILDSKSFEKEIVVERKANLSELSNNFCSGRKRFENEFCKAKELGAKVILLIEDAYGREKMLLRRSLDADKSLTAEQRQKKTWKSNFTANAMVGSIAAWKERYGFELVFCDKRSTAGEMLDRFYKYFVEAKERVENG